jgi:oligopeptidase A
MSNLLLSQASTLHTLPQFSAVEAKLIKPAIEQAIADSKAIIARVLSENKVFTWDNLVAPVDAVDDVLGKLFSPISHMNSVVSSDELREAYESCLPLLSEYGTFVGQHHELYQAYQQLVDSAEYQQCDTAQKKVIDNALRDFKLSGISLNDDDKKRYGEIVTRLSELSSAFSNNTLDATEAFTVNLVDKKDVAGLPESILEAAQALAASKEDTAEGSYSFSLNMPSYLPVMMYCDNRELRETLYRAFVTRASDQGPNAGEYDNSEIMNELLALRHELAQLLGFDNFAVKSIATKMASSTREVLDFLENLAIKSQNQGKKDFQELTDFAASEYQVSDLNAWDLAYYSEKLKQSRYAISDQELRPYFPETKVVPGLFEVVNRLFGLTIKQRDDVDVWHSDVKFFDVFDANNNQRGSFYLDLYARDKKRGGAWMDVCIGRRQLTAQEQGDDSRTVQLPVAYLTCNFNAPVGGKPALFTHDEVVTLFHEFGHGIHHMLTQINASGVSGINGVPWDAVELPSQFLENWCWQPEALAFISGHFETGEPLPQALLDKMLAAKNFQSAMQMLRQLEFSIFDFTMHANYNPTASDEEKAQHIQQTLDQVREKYAVTTAAPFNRFQHGFAHIFAGGYSAGYYSYKWAEVLSADAFSRFEEEGIFNKQVGQDFLLNVLEKGGSEEPSLLFKAFRGRAPEINALLRHCGIEG